MPYVSIIVLKDEFCSSYDDLRQLFSHFTWQLGSGSEVSGYDLKWGHDLHFCQVPGGTEAAFPVAPRRN